MKLQLIPVFELEYSHPEIKFPAFPFTDEEYGNYLDQVYKSNGFIDKYQLDLSKVHQLLKFTLMDQSNT